MPDATLAACEGDDRAQGTHFAGPTWQWSDSSTFVGSKGAGFKIGKALTANGSITGAIHGRKFTAQGTVSFDALILGHRYPATGKLTVSNDGVVACAKIPALSKTSDSGLFVGWDGTITPYDGRCPFP